MIALLAQAVTGQMEKLGGEVNATVVGMVVIVLMQLGGFFMQTRRSWGADEAAKKKDLAAVEARMEARVKEVESDVESLGKSIEHKIELMGQNHSNSQASLHEKVNEVAKQGSALVKAQQLYEQQLSNIGTKIDTLIRRRP